MKTQQFLLASTMALALFLGVLAARGQAAPVVQGVWIMHAPENSVVNDLAIEGDTIWTATNGDGVIRWRRSDGSMTQLTTADGLASNKVRAIAVDPAGHKWFGTEGGASYFDGQTWTTYTTTHGLIDPKVTDIAIEENGHVWFATWGGVSEFDGQNWYAYTRPYGLPNNHVYTVAIDRAGHKWFGTPNGAAEFDGQT